jgi:hypothetical protein
MTGPPPDKRPSFIGHLMYKHRALSPSFIVSPQKHLFLPRWNFYKLALRSSFVTVRLRAGFLPTSVPGGYLADNANQELPHSLCQ